MRDKAYAFTIQGEWLPELSTPLPESAVHRPAKPPLRISLISDVCRGNETPLDTEMRIFGAATRWAFNRLSKGQPRKEIKALGQKVFHLNSRYIDDAILKAQAIIDSQKKLVPSEIEETERKLGKTEKKIKGATSKAKKFEASGRALEAEREKRRLPGLKARREKLQAKLETYRRHLAEGTIPKVVFGGRRLWRRVTRGQVTLAAWRYAAKSPLCRR